MPKFRIAAGALAAALALGAVGASAQGYYDHYDSYHHYHAYHHYYHACKRRAGNTGAILGGVGGALIGNALGGGHLAGTLIGGGVGAVAGHEIARNNAHC
ncbi:MAG: glycine zipper 2TM domain-containing protein [Caulobacteraceae bacterium]|nr:glycine zipper 2TM domain-containing protein [Caulobacteraceae bacterium]